MNLLQNAFKFTPPHAEVVLNAYASGDRIFIDVKDRCGGLEPGDVERMFLPTVSTGKGPPGLGLGLAIARRSVEASSGSLTVRDVPGEGCILTINLPRHVVHH